MMIPAWNLWRSDRQRGCWVKSVRACLIALLAWSASPIDAAHASTTQATASATDEQSGRDDAVAPRPQALRLPRLVAAPVHVDDAGAESLHLYVGEVRVLQAGTLRRIAIGNGKVLQASALDRGQLLIIPEAPGQSVIHLWTQGGGERRIAVTVVPADANRLLDEVRAMLGESTGVQPRIVGDKVVIDGDGVSDEQAARIAEVANRYPQIVNLVSRVGRERMIEMDVRMVEVRRDAMQDIGVRWSTSMHGPSFGVIGDLHRSRSFRADGAAGYAGLDTRPRIAPFATALGIASSITSMIHLMVQNGDAIVLAEPRLACRSGGSARFVAGGELPIAHTSGLAGTSVQFREYGVKFDVSPVASESGVISAKIATEISAIDFEVQIQNVPGLIKRRAETEVNLREHETLVIAGLLTEESSRSIDRVPGLGELPILGNLFRSRNFRDRRSDLVVFITPRFVGADPSEAQAQLDRSTELLDTARARVRMVD